MKKILILATVFLITGTAFSVSAEEDEKPKGSSTLQVGYSPMFLAGAARHMDGSGSSTVSSGLVHGGSLSFDWRGKGYWGVYVPLSVNVVLSGSGSSRGNVNAFIGIGANAIVHTRERDKTIDPYMLLGGRIFIAPNTGSGGFLPVPSLGFGVRGYFTKNIGLYAEAVANPILLPGIFGGAIIEGKAGLSVRF